jgi:hypothetical protein
MSQAKRHSNERHPVFYFMSFINPYSPLTDIVIVHIFYINETTPRPRIHPFRANSRPTTYAPKNHGKKHLRMLLCYHNYIIIFRGCSKTFF